MVVVRIPYNQQSLPDIIKTNPHTQKKSLDKQQGAGLNYERTLECARGTFEVKKTHKCSKLHRDAHKPVRVGRKMQIQKKEPNSPLKTCTVRCNMVLISYQT